MVLKPGKNVFRLIDIMIDIIFFSINWKKHFDRSILVISMTVVVATSIKMHDSSRRKRAKGPRAAGDYSTH